jgi:hypothetical protein
MRTSLLALLVCLLGSPGCEAFLGRQGRRRLTEAGDGAGDDGAAAASAAAPVEVDMDAATGTVKAAVAEDNTAASMSCDGQMAQSLVQANAALETTSHDRDAALAKLVALESTVESLTSKMTSMESAHSTIVENLQELIETLGSSAMEEAVKDLEAEKQAMVLELETKLGEKSKESESLLEATREEAKKYLVKEVSTVKEELDKLKKSHVDTLSEKEKHLKHLAEQQKKLAEAQKGLEAALNEAEAVRIWTNPTILIGLDVCLHFWILTSPFFLFAILVRSIYRSSNIGESPFPTAPTAT